MKYLSFAALLFACLNVKAQYYYKDIVGTKETSAMMKAYNANKVSRVVLNSYDADNTKSDDFYVEQYFSPSEQKLVTTTRSGITGESTLTSFINANGNVIRTIDSSETMVSTTVYNYDGSGKLISVNSTSSDSSKSINELEEHQWNYEGESISGMLRIKGKRDTTYVSFKKDDNGNIIEEQSTRKGVKSDPVYYYYDGNNRLTDIVRFNNKAKRLLPEYMFEYSPANQVIQKITVPANGSEYLIWRYQYDNRGLRIKEAIYDKHKQLTGKIEYQYQLGGS